MYIIENKTHLNQDNEVYENHYQSDNRVVSLGVWHDIMITEEGMRRENMTTPFWKKVTLL